MLSIRQSDFWWFCVEPGVGLADPYESLPTCDTMWFYNCSQGQGGYLVPKGCIGNEEAVDVPTTVPEAELRSRISAEGRWVTRPSWRHRRILCQERSGGTNSAAQRPAWDGSSSPELPGTGWSSRRQPLPSSGTARPRRAATRQPHEQHTASEPGPGRGGAAGGGEAARTGRCRAGGAGPGPGGLERAVAAAVGERSGYGGMASSQGKNEPRFADWMAALPDSICSTPLTNLAIPGRAAPAFPPLRRREQVGRCPPSAPRDRGGGGKWRRDSRRRCRSASPPGWSRSGNRCRGSGAVRGASAVLGAGHPGGRCGAACRALRPGRHTAGTRPRVGGAPAATSSLPDFLCFFIFHFFFLSSEVRAVSWPRRGGGWPWWVGCVALVPCPVCWPRCPPGSSDAEAALVSLELPWGKRPLLASFAQQLLVLQRFVTPAEDLFKSIAAVSLELVFCSRKLCFHSLLQLMQAVAHLLLLHCVFCCRLGILGVKLHSLLSVGTQHL